MARTISRGSFVWDAEKEKYNIQTHQLDFLSASHAFFDPLRIIAVDEAHSEEEPRFFCVGKVQGKIATVRFTYRSDQIRIIGAGFWRKGRKLYEETNKKNEE
ncbi:MAG: BrnT family toxin [Deltaproteobacteria bacterium]|nr:BrnT family toxin [Deltaproteobacteria bacterium]